jgi:nucleoside-triphosphatase THEP1
LTIIVRWDKILIQVGFFKLIKREIKKSEIKQVRAIDGFSKMQYGIKVIGRTIAYIFWGKGAVEIELNEKSSNSLLSKLTNFNKIIITSQNPTRLVEAIMSMG